MQATEKMPRMDVLIEWEVEKHAKRVFFLIPWRDESRDCIDMILGIWSLGKFRSGVFCENRLSRCKSVSRSGNDGSGCCRARIFPYPKVDCSEGRTMGAGELGFASLFQTPSVPGIAETGRFIATSALSGNSASRVAAVRADCSLRANSFQDFTSIPPFFGSLSRSRLTQFLLAFLLSPDIYDLRALYINARSPLLLRVFFRRTPFANG